MTMGVAQKTKIQTQNAKNQNPKRTTVWQTPIRIWPTAIINIA